MTTPRVCILKTDGLNRDEELAYAFTLAGGKADIVHINKLSESSDSLDEYQILGIPGGFCYGDDIAAGKVLAIELYSRLKDQVSEFVEKGKLVFGVCNGFQVLVRTGLLPFGELGKQRVTLALNGSSHFECRWAKLRVEATNSVFTQGLEGQIWEAPVAHGEGRLDCDEATLAEIEAREMVTLRFVDESGKRAEQYPVNPNGSPHAITGLTDPTGRIFGLMPHLESFVLPMHHPNWRRMDSSKEPDGVHMFRNAVKAVS